MSHARVQPADLWPDVDFSPMEVAMLQHLLASPQRAVSTDELLREVWGYHSNAKSTTVKTTVHRLRGKIEPDPDRPRHLLTLRGRGYQLVPPSEDGASHTVLVQTERRTNLVTEPARFVGRTEDLDRVQQLLAEGRRLVTLHGGAGLGKTSLARQVASRVVDAYPGGVWFCELAHTTDGEQALGVVAQVLGIVRTHQATASVVEALVAALLPRGKTLLVLDNLEQLDPSAYKDLPHLLGRCPDLQIVVTSRVRLNVSGETLHEVAPLTLDDGVTLLHDRIDAVRLDRAQPLETDVLRDLVEILEGVPLALEMAAGRARVLPLRELRSRLRMSFGVLDGQPSDRPARQQTLDEAIAWSWQLLSQDEAAALAQLCAFRGGCSIEAAEEVLECEPSPLDAITALLDKSMVRTWRSHGQLRLGMYESVRTFVTAHGGQALNGARERHARWAQRVASEWARDFDATPTAGACLVRELDNLLAATEWLTSQGRSEATDLLWSLRHLYYERRLPADYTRRVERTRGTLGLTGPRAHRMHLALAGAYSLRKERKRVMTEVERGLARVGPTDPIHADLTLCLARATLLGGDHHRAVALARQAVALAEEHGTEESLPRHLNVLGRTLQHLDRQAEAVEVFRRAISETERTGAPRLASTVWGNLALCYRHMGDFRSGFDCLRRARELAERFDDVLLVHWTKAQMAPLLAHIGELEQANELFRDVLEMDERLEQSNLSPATRTNAGITAMLCGDTSRATAVLDAARLQMKASGNDGGANLAICISNLVVCRATDDDLEGAEQNALELDALDDLPERFRLQVEISLGHLHLLRARRALATGDAEAAARHRAEAERRASHGASPDEGPGLTMVRGLLQRALEKDNA